MYLKRLEIQGFKSFANKTTLEFEKGITSVVGPNGSGKSNIADSIRWVLGEQSLKQLRGKKSEDVIFAGSEKKSRMSFAEVTVTFDNESRKIPIDYAEVSITRRIDRSGESDYLINGNKVRLLDIVDLILKSNINTSRYTVIGQGTIDQMILSGPGEIKSLIDEASGVKTYYLRRDKSLKRLETTAQNLIRVNDLLSEIEPRLKGLRRQAKRMQERAAIEEELKICQKEFYSGKYWQLEDSLAEFNAKLAILEKERLRLAAEIDGQRRSLDKSEHSNRNEVVEYQRIQSEIKRLTDSKNKLAEDAALIRGKLQAQKGVGLGNVDKKSLDIEKNVLENSKAHLQAEIEKSLQAQAIISKRFDGQQSLFAEISQKLADLQNNLNNPEHIHLDDIYADVEELDRAFGQFYGSLQNSQDIVALLPMAEKFRANLGNFKNKTAELAKNPLLNFEKQRRALQDVLAQKDNISQELNRMDLEKSKVQINLQYLQGELTKIDQKLLQTNLDLQSAGAVNIDDYFASLIEQEQKINKEILAIAGNVAALEQKITEYHSREQSRKTEILEEERLYRAQQDALSKLKDQESALQIEQARLDTQKEALMPELVHALGQQGLTEIQAGRQPGAVDYSGVISVGAAAQASGTSNTHRLEERIQKLKGQLEMIGGIDELTLKEYQETEQRFTYLSSQVIDLQKGMDDLRAVIEELDVHIKKQFHAAFDNIDQRFQQYFRVLFNGGRAYLSLVHPSKEKEQGADQEAGGEAAEGDDANSGSETSAATLRPEEKILAKYEKGVDDISGIDIKATPPGKKLSSISALSGGERALTSIALLCSLLSCFPSPFVVLDEVDAALDEANTIRFAEILGTLASQTQFIAVTHNRETMRKAHTLYGITMGDDSISKVLSLKIDQAQVYAK